MSILTAKFIIRNIFVALMLLGTAPALATEAASETTSEAAPVMEAAPAPVAETPVPGEAAATGGDSSAAKQAFIIDYDTGAVLFEKNADEQMPTSSMSKTITMYMVFEALKSGKLSLDSELSVSEKAWRMGGSKMFVEVNNKVKVEDLIRGVIVQSGNDATVVLAEGIAGTEEGFADLMNAKAQELGMSASHFMNASGWPDPEHYSTARDLTMLGAALIRNFPDLYHYYSETEFTYNNIRQPNRNPLLYRNIGADGIKTGHTEQAGYGLMASGKRDGRRVVMTLNGMASMEERSNESARLLDWALRSFQNITMFKPGDVVEGAEVIMGMKETVPVTVNENVLVTVPVAVRNDLKAQIIYKGPLVAPVKKGDAVGILRVTVPRMGTHEYPVVAAEDMPALGLFAGTITKLRMMIGGSDSVR